MKRLLEPVLKPLTGWYLSKKRHYRYKGMQVTVHPGVFHPGLFMSTRILLDYLDRQSLAGKRVLELGSGAGLIACWAAQKGAKVTATDIDEKAVHNTRENARQLNLSLEVIRSDLFHEIPRHLTFDWIIINPPYYPYDPEEKNDWSFYCGTNHEYFQRLFDQLGDHIHADTQVVMILSEDCQVETIRFLAREKNWQMDLLHSQKRWGERNDVFSIKAD